MKYSIITTAFTALCLNCMADQVTVGENASSANKAAEDVDLLRFSNSDTLHGLFLGFDEDATIIWKNPETSDPIRFSTKKIHRIVLNRGHAHQKAALESTLTLVNGDIIAGAIASADAETITLISSHLGTLTIPRNTVSTITPTPYGGKLLYYGPLSPKGWKTISPMDTTKNDQEEPKKKEESQGLQF